MLRYRQVKQRAAEYVRAVREEPKGVLCGWCHKPNFFFDDCGWICITPDGYRDGKPTRCAACCENCWRGPLGEAHISHFGLGDR